MTEQRSTLEEITTLASELSHHVNNPLAVVMASMGSLERLTREVTAASANQEQREELENIISDMQQGLSRIAQVVSRLNKLSFQITRRKDLLGDPFSKQGRE
jgi:hypothetical protein